MAVPKARKPKYRTFNIKEVRERCEATGHQVQLVMAAAIQDVLKIDADQLLDVLKEAANYSRFYDERIVELKNVAESIYKHSNGEIDLMKLEERLRRQGKTR